MKVPNALLSAGFRGPEEVKRAIQRLGLSGVSQEHNWEEARTRLWLRYHVDIGPSFRPTKEVWELVKVIAALAEDNALEVIARRAIASGSQSSTGQDESVPPAKNTKKTK